MSRRDAPLSSDPIELIRWLGKLGRMPPGQHIGRVATLLSHSDIDVRAEAVRLLTVLWRVADYHDVAFRIATDAGEPEDVREQAIYGLSAISQPRDRGRDVGALISIAESPMEPLTIRGSAYDALLILERMTGFPTVRREFDPVIDLDSEWLLELRQKYRIVDEPNQS
ncbi:MAG: hypothetical protein ABFS34_12815 [Gemmatimonadota bacterium]